MIRPNIGIYEHVDMKYVPSFHLFSELRHGMEKQKQRKLSKDERLVFFQKAKTFFENISQSQPNGSQRSSQAAMGDKECSTIDVEKSRSTTPELKEAKSKKDISTEASNLKKIQTNKICPKESSKKDSLDVKDVLCGIEDDDLCLHLDTCLTSPEKCAPETDRNSDESIIIESVKPADSIVIDSDIVEPTNSIVIDNDIVKPAPEDSIIIDSDIEDPPLLSMSHIGKKKGTKRKKETTGERSKKRKRMDKRYVRYNNSNFSSSFARFYFDKKRS